MCAAPRSNYLLRSLPPSLTEEFAGEHDAGVAQCLRELLASEGPLHRDALAARRARPPFRLGGLGLRSANEGRAAAFWASWADTLPRLRARRPRVVAEVLQQAVLVAEGDGRAAPSVVELTQAVESLRECGFEAPSWDRLVEGGKRPPGAANERVPGESLRGSAAASLDASACAGLFLDLDPASRALMLSQAGPCGARALTALPTAPEFRLQSSHYSCGDCACRSHSHHASAGVAAPSTPSVTTALRVPPPASSAPGAPAWPPTLCFGT